MAALKRLTVVALWFAIAIALVPPQAAVAAPAEDLMTFRARLTAYMTDAPRPASSDARSGRAVVSKWCRDLAHMVMPVNREGSALLAHGSPRG